MSEVFTALTNVISAIDLTTLTYGLISSLIASGCVHGIKRYTHRPRVGRQTTPTLKVELTSKADMLRRANFAN